MSVGYTPGGPEQVATDAVSGAHYQVVKLDVGASGASSPVTSANPLPVGLGTAVIVMRPASVVGTDRSLAATTTSAQLMAANSSRSRFFIKNDSTVDVWINFGATAAATPGSGNMKINAGSYFEFSGGSSAINIVAASGTAAITAREF